MPPDGSATSLQMDFFRPATLTSATSETLRPVTWRDTFNATSLPVSADGPTPSAPPAGPTIAPSGPEVAPASLSPRQAKAMGLMTSGTFGRPGSGSLSSRALSELLGSRLKAQTAGCGSTLYRLTWKRQGTRSGRWFCALRASVRPTSDTAATGWPTPDAQLMNDGADLTKHMARLERLKAKHGNGNGAGMPLGIAAKLAGWATPHEGDHRPGHPSRMADTSRINLMDQALLAGWATPAARDYRTPNHETYAERGGGPKGEQLQNQVAHVIPGASLNGSTASTDGSGLLNPDFSRWLQGIPATWPSCAPTATRSTSRSRRSSSAPGLNP